MTVVIHKQQQIAAGTSFAAWILVAMIGRGPRFSTQSFSLGFFRAIICCNAHVHHLNLNLYLNLRGLAKFTLASNCLKRVCNGECEKQPNGSYSFMCAL